jgi:integrase
MSKLPCYVWQSNSRLYYFRRSIPPQLRHHFPQTSGEIKRSLRTDSRKEAIKRARVWTIETDQLFDELMAKHHSRTAHLKTYLITHIELNPDGSEKSRTIIDNPELERDIAHRLVGVGHAQKQPVKNSPLFSEVSARFMSDRRQRLAPGTLKDTAQTLSLFQDVMGDMPFAEIKALGIKKFRDAVVGLPPRGRASKYNGFSVQQLLEMDIPTTERLKSSVVNKHVAKLAALWTWALRQDDMGVDTNPCNSIEPLPIPRRDPEEKCFAADELKRLFESDNYKEGFDSPFKYWCPLIALYTGARIGEVAQLHLSDIKKIDAIDAISAISSIYAFDLNDYTEDKRIKNKKARKVPIHPILLNLGLIRYADELAVRGETRLFPELTNSRDGYGQYLGDWFRKYRRKCGLPNIESRNTHGFRYTFQNALRALDADELKIDAIVGHADTVAMRRVYRAPKAVASLYETIKALDYGLDHPPFYR